ncbi:MAG: hypothetical protein HQM09_08595 [Candidatus Riflebacteria bacterium]|nr:hypothetical protein [Candidatus Riflebacteria bacterium]
MTFIISACPSETSGRSRRRLLHPLPLIGLFVACFVFHIWQGARVEPQATMDAAYYHILTDRLIEGHGFTEPFTWHCLHKYKTLEHPIDYWLPLGSTIFAASRLAVHSIASPPPFDPEITLNRLLWALLSAAVFIAAVNRDLKPRFALLAWAIVAFGGRFAFFVSTSDNVAFYAWFGFILFEALNSPTPLPVVTGVITGLMCLTRAEGPLFALFAAYRFMRGSRRRAAVVTLTATLLIISPWFLRNYTALGTIWPSQTKAFFLREYNDMFEPDSPTKLAEFTATGLVPIIRIRGQALIKGFTEMFLMPVHLLFFPFWTAGLIAYMIRKKSAPSVGLPAEITGSLPFFQAFFCITLSVLLPVQSMNGTFMHVAAAFFPHAALLAAAGLAESDCSASSLARLFTRPSLFILYIAWCAIFSVIGITTTDSFSRLDFQPYTDLELTRHLSRNDIVASPDPVRVNLLTQCQGVCLPRSYASNTGRVIEFARSYNCSAILFDNRHAPIPEDILSRPDLHELASTAHLLLLSLN